MIKLEDIQKKNPYHMPEGYVDLMQEKLADHISSEEVKLSPEEFYAKRNNQPSWMQRLNKWAFAALAVAIIAAITLPMLQMFDLDQNEPTVNLQQAMNELKQEDIEMYVLANLDEFSADELADEQALEEANIFDFQESITNEDLIDYLINSPNLNVTEDFL